MHAPCVPPVFAINKPIEPHPLLGEQSQARDFWRRSDKAKWDYATGVDAAGQPILPKHEREPSDRHSRRRAQAIVRRYMRPILDRYNDFVYRGQVMRPDAAGAYAMLREDCDGAGTDLAVFWRKQSRKAATDGLAYVLVDANDPNTYTTAAQENAAGKRGILRAIDADDVIWWRDWQGEVVEAVVLCSDKSGDRFAWYVTETTTQRIALKVQKGGTTLVVASIDEAKPHTYGGCPLVRLQPDFSECGGDDSQGAPLAEGQKRICNIDSWLFEELQGSTFTTTVLLGVSADQVKDVAVGPGQALCLPNSGGSNPSVGRIGADTTQAESIRKSLEMEVRELYRAAGLSSGNPTEVGQPESGVAKAFSFNEVEAKCAAIADAAEKAENRATMLLSKGFAFSYPGDADYPDQFESPDLADELSSLIQMQTADLPAVLLDSQVKRIADVGFQLTGPEKAELDKQMADQKKQAEAAKASPFITPPSGPPGT